jgi:hypothetical protein
METLEHVMTIPIRKNQMELFWLIYGSVPLWFASYQLYTTGAFSTRWIDAAVEHGHLNIIKDFVRHSPGGMGVHGTLLCNILQACLQHRQAAIYTWLTHLPREAWAIGMGAGPVHFHHHRIRGDLHAEWIEFLKIIYDTPIHSTAIIDPVWARGYVQCIIGLVNPVDSWLDSVQMKDMWKKIRRWAEPNPLERWILNGTTTRLPGPGLGESFHNPGSGVGVVDGGQEVYDFTDAQQEQIQPST